MKGDIIYAVQQETRALLQSTDFTIILKTDFKAGNLPTYAMPLILMVLTPEEGSGQLLGGLTQLEYQWDFEVYNYSPDISGMDPTSTSATLQNVADLIRRHWSNFSTYLSQEMVDAFNNYGIRFTFNGLGNADPLQHPDGLIMGEKIKFDMIAFDDETTGIVSPGPTPLQTIIQIGYPGETPGV